FPLQTFITRTLPNIWRGSCAIFPFNTQIKQKFNMVPSAKETKKKAKPTSAANGSSRSSNGNGAHRGANGNGNGAARAAKEKIYENDSLLDDKDLLRVLLQVRNGNFSVRVPIGEVGIKGRIFDTLNEIITLN